MLGATFVARAPEDTASALKGARAAFVGVGLTSGFLNLLGLTGSIYMLQVYDRVIPGRSIQTLVALSFIVLMLYVAQGVFEVMRAKLLIRVGAHLDARLRERVFASMMRMPLLMKPSASTMDPPRDLDTVRAFLSGAGPTALFDMPWMPIYLALVFSLHPLLGALAIGGAVLMIALTGLTELLTRAPAMRAAASGVARTDMGQASRRNAEVVAGLGMAGALTRIWSDLSARHLDDQVRAADLAATLGAISRIVRLALQSAVLGLGAYLVIEQQATSGVMIAASITVARALAPVEVAVGNWRGFVAARLAFRRLGQLMATLPAAAERLVLPAPRHMVSVEGLMVGAPAQSVPLIRDISFSLRAGMALGIIGLSGSGKSTLARAMVGAWMPLRGAVRLDGATLDQFDADQLGHHLGYLPQDVELFEGSIAQNISRFRPEATDEAVVAAAELAGIDQFIRRLPDGYETQIGPGGAMLSAGQRQRVGLARALFGHPFLVVLDEPNSNLDSEGEAALTEAIQSMRQRGSIVVVVAHRTAAIAAVDQLLVMHDGQMNLFGPRDEVLRDLARQKAHLRVVTTAPQVASATAPQSQAIGAGS